MERLLKLCNETHSLPLSTLPPSPSPTSILTLHLSAADARPRGTLQRSERVAVPGFGRHQDGEAGWRPTGPRPPDRSFGSGRGEAGCTTVKRKKIPTLMVRELKKRRGERAGCHGKGVLTHLGRLARSDEVHELALLLDFEGNPSDGIAVFGGGQNLVEAVRGGEDGGRRK